jgi:hypothetical protein
MSPFPLQQSAAGAEPAGLNLGNLWRRVALPRPHREVLADELAATVRENGRAAGETCGLLLAPPCGRTSEAAAIRPDAGRGGSPCYRYRQDRCWFNFISEIGVQPVWDKERCCKSETQHGAICDADETFGALRIEILHTMRGGGTMVCFLPLLRLKRRFQKKLSLQGRMQCCQTGFSTQKRRNGRSSLSRTRKRLHR